MGRYIIMITNWEERERERLEEAREKLLFLGNHEMICEMKEIFVEFLI